jgi:glycosyltransferase involved in cell wall biosynthesis
MLISSGILSSPTLDGSEMHGEGGQQANSILLSIVIPTHNRSTELRELVNRAGSRSGSELVVVDDASLPAHSSHNLRAVEAVSNARYIKQVVGKGAPAARNLGAAESSGKYLWFFDDDDILEGVVVGSAIERLNRGAPPIALLSSRHLYDGRMLSMYSPSPERDNFQQYRNQGHLVSLPSVIIRRDIFDAAGGWDESLVAGQDTDLLLRVTSNCPPVCWPDLFVDINVGDGPRITNSVGKQQRAKLQILAKHWHTFTWQRRLYYLASYGLVIPFWKALTGRKVARQLLKREQR